jgi:hypothetical protein
VVGENSADHILINKDAESQCDLLGNPRTTPAWITLLHLKNDPNEFGARPFRAGLSSPLGRKEQSVLTLYQMSMEPKQCRWLQDNRGSDKPTRVNEEGIDACEKSINSAEVWRAASGPIKDQ